MYGFAFYDADYILSRIGHIYAPAKEIPWALIL